MNASDPLSLMKNYPVLLQRIAFAHFDFDVVSSDKNYPISVRPGRVDPRSGGRPDFTIKASSETWAEFAKATPRPGFNDVIAMIESGHAQLEGDALPLFRNLFFVKAVAAAIFKGDPRS